MFLDILAWLGALVFPILIVIAMIVDREFRNVILGVLAVYFITGWIVWSFMTIFGG